MTTKVTVTVEGPCGPIGKMIVGTRIGNTTLAHMLAPGETVELLVPPNVVAFAREATPEDIRVAGTA